MAKLYEILARKAGLMEEEKVLTEEEKIFNPLGVKVGSAMSISDIDLRGLEFFVREIHELRANINGDEYKFADYDLLARPLGKDDVAVRLRVMPEDNPDSLCTHRTIVLGLMDEFGYDEGFEENVLKDDTGIFQIDPDDRNPEPVQYWRPGEEGNFLLDSYSFRGKRLRDSDGDGSVEEGEVGRFAIDSWDYSRATDIDGVDTEEFLFVEKDTETGWFQLWRGPTLNPEQIEAF